MVLQAGDLGLLFECPALPDSYISQEASFAIAVHGTKSGLHLFTESCHLHLFSAVHKCQPIVNKSEQGPQLLMCFSRNLDNVFIGE